MNPVELVAGTASTGDDRIDAPNSGLLGYLQSASRPPVLRSTITISIAAPSPESLEERVALCRQAWGEVRLHRPLGAQLSLVQSTPPGQACRVAGYEDVLTVEEAGALMPFAIHAVGSTRGFYLGHTLVGFAPARAPRPRGGLAHQPPDHGRHVGALDSGKTMLSQKLLDEPLCAEVGLPPRRCMRLMGHTNPNFTMSVYQHVLDMTAGAQEIFESVTGASFQEAFAIPSERELPTIFRPLAPETPSQRPAPTDP
ncbi:MAG TPA: hypothetical protein VFL73_12450 [Solirubrobacteraceae bacterium]|nr:hypothetical protein [Solirubrobacteraceae bacterium]